MTVHSTFTTAGHRAPCDRFPSPIRVSLTIGMIEGVQWLSGRPVRDFDL
jgi:hypothetical protein